MTTIIFRKCFFPDLWSPYAFILIFFALLRKAKHRRFGNSGQELLRFSVLCMTSGNSHTDLGQNLPCLISCFWQWSVSAVSEERRTGKHLIGHVSSNSRISYHLIRLSSTEVLQDVWHSAWEKSVFSFTNAESGHFRWKFTNHCFYLVQKWSKMYLSLENKYNPLKLTILWFSLKTLITLGIWLIILYSHFGTNVDSFLCINSSYFSAFYEVHYSHSSSWPEHILIFLLMYSI